MEKFMTKDFAPGLALDTGEFIPASDLNAQTAAPQVQTSATKGNRTGDIEMTDKEQPTALHLAELLESEVDDAMERSAVELRRLYAENEAIRTGYSAARLEIESLQLQLTDQGRVLEKVMRALVQAQRPTNGEQTTAYAAKHYAKRDHVAQGAYYVNHVSAMTGEGLHAKSAIAAELAHRDMEIDRLRASHGQAPAGATLPEGWVPLVITHEGQYPEEIAYGPQRMMDRLDKWLRKYFDSVVAAPTTQPAPQPAPPQEAQEPVAWLEYARKKPSLSRLAFTKTSDKELRVAGWVTEPLSIPKPAAQGDALDAARYRWLRNPTTNVAMVLDKRTGYVPADELVPGVGGYHTYEYRAGDELDAAIDAARAAQGDALDAERLDWLRENSCDLRCVDSPTGQGDGDIHWVVIEHHMAEPVEREIGRAYRDDPRAAIDAARAAQEKKA